MVNLRIRITGKVQGVGFRFETKRVASLLGLKGYVKNEDDGSVFVEVEGPSDMVFKMIDYCHHGPENAKVDKVSVTEGVITYHLDFEIIK